VRTRSTSTLPRTARPDPGPRPGRTTPSPPVAAGSEPARRARTAASDGSDGCGGSARHGLRRCVAGTLNPVHDRDSLATPRISTGRNSIPRHPRSFD
jgi:hypothetical protein